MSSSFWYSELFLTVFYYYILASILTCFLVVCSTSAAHAVLFLVVLFLLVSFIFVFIGAEYLGLVYIIVYVGAIAVLFLFVVMLLDLRNIASEGFTPSGAATFSTCVMLAADVTLYMLDYGHLPFFHLPLIPVSSFISPYGETISIVDNLSFLSPELFNIYSFYVLGCGFILAFVMVGVVVMLSHTIFVKGERYHLRHKLTTSSNRVVFRAQKRNGL